MLCIFRLHPEYEQAMNNLGNLLRDSGNLDEAENLLTQAINIRPNFAAAWMNLGIVQAGLGKYEDAEFSYKTALSHRPKYPDCYYNLGNLVRTNLVNNPKLVTNFKI
jgi:protein O-mannosyl-transferase